MIQTLLHEGSDTKRIMNLGYFFNSLSGAFIRSPREDSESENVNKYSYFENLIASKLAEIPQITRIMSSRHGNMQSIWSFIETDDLQLRKKIYKVELQVIRNFPAVNFDFHLVPLDKCGSFPFPTGANILYPIR